MAGRAKENLPGGSLRYQFVYLKVRIFKCSYRIYIYTLTIYYHSLGFAEDDFGRPFPMGSPLDMGNPLGKCRTWSYIRITKLGPSLDDEIPALY